MNLICQNKCENKYCENKINSAYIKRIIKLIGPVILGSKPSEIVNIPGTREERVMKLQEIENFFKNCLKIKYRVITKRDNRKRILFINEDSMIKCLENKKCKNFLKFLGYPKDYSLKAYIDELVDRLESDEFPDEIGIFLGYPLKDVLGFMGYSKKDFTCVCSWRFYGDVEASYEVYNRFARDKEKMRKMVERLSVWELREVI